MAKADQEFRKDPDVLALTRALLRFSEAKDNVEQRSEPVQRNKQPELTRLWEYLQIAKQT